jgi:UTP--glucose-1-phosphate uridylyltransferase
MKAIIPAAGLGTRFLPVTRVVPKEMLPVGSRPALELIVEEARAAGADETAIVISEGKELIRKYFEGQPDIRFVYQREQRGLGHAVLQAEVDDDVLVLLGDALVVGCCAAREMVDVSRSHGGAAVVGCERVPREKASRYGILKLEGDRIVDMVEKPSPEEAPSDVAVAGRYLLPAAIFGYLKTQAPGKGGEIQLTDAIRRMLAEREAYAYVYPGRRQDIGNPDGYFAALEAYRGNN